MEMKNTTDNATYTVGNVTYNVDKIFQDEKKILPEEYAGYGNKITPKPHLHRGLKIHHIAP